MFDTQNTNINEKNKINVVKRKKTIKNLGPISNAQHITPDTLQNNLFPLCILNNKVLSPLEAIVKYLRENKKQSYKEISSLLSRNAKTLAVTYSKAIQKNSEETLVNKDTIYLDFSIFKNDLSILEAVCYFLRSLEKKYSQIARLIGRSQKTIWTVCKRAENKLQNSQNLQKISDTPLNKDTDYGDNNYISSSYTDNNALRLPLNILKDNSLSPLEAIVKYLRENKDLTYNQIGNLLSRKPKTLAATYSAARKKDPEKIILDEDTIYYIDFSIFSKTSDTRSANQSNSQSNNSLSILEAVCTSLKNSGLHNSQISRILGKSQKTVWTVCKRAEKKLASTISEDKMHQKEDNE